MSFLDTVFWVWYAGCLARMLKLQPNFQGSYKPAQAQSPQFKKMRPNVEKRPEELYAASKESFKERIKGVLDPQIIRAPLTRDNYKKKFHHMICWEEKRHIEILDEKYGQIKTSLC